MTKCRLWVVEVAEHDDAADVPHRGPILLARKPRAVGEVDGVNGVARLATQQSAYQPRIDVWATARPDPTLGPAMSADSVAGVQACHRPFAVDRGWRQWFRHRISIVGSDWLSQGRWFDLSRTSEHASGAAT